MLFWVLLAITLVCIAIVIIMISKGFDFEYHCGVGIVTTIIIITLVITVLVMAGSIIYTNVMEDSYAEAMVQRHEILTYQLENNMYDNDNEYGKKDLYDQIQAWNEDLARDKIMQDDFWIGIFYYHVYEQFDFIELPEK